MELLPNHEATLVYPLTIASPLDERRLALDITIHYMDKGSKLFGRLNVKPVLELELTSSVTTFLDPQLIFIGVTSLAVVDSSVGSFFSRL